MTRWSAAPRSAGAGSPAASRPGRAWGRPKRVAEIAFAEWTADDKLRQPAFLGRRMDRLQRRPWSERER
jgi:bifunctional non-homologous end joining protein LigD